MTMLVQHAAAYSTWLLVAATAFFLCSVVHVVRMLTVRPTTAAPSPGSLPDTSTADLEVRYLQRLVDEAPAPRTFDLGAVVGRTVAARRAAGMRLDVFTRSTRVQGVPEDLAVALDSLLANAHVHGQGRGVRVESARAGDFVEVVVSDLGPGVPDYVRPQLFGPGVSAGEESGAGLGLHISRNLLRDSGGDLLLRETEEGAAFVARIPAQRRGSRQR